MSLINDALKRAKQAHETNSPPPAPPLRPVEPPRGPDSKRGGWWVWLLLLIAVVGITFLWVTPRRDKLHPSAMTIAPATPPIVVDADAPTKPVSEPADSLAAAAPPAVASSPTPLSPSATQPDATNVTDATAASPTPVATQAEPAQPIAAMLPIAAPLRSELPRLQGIFYRPDRPAAILDGKTVLIGDTSGEHRVVAIGQQSVTLVRAGVTNVLSLGD